MQDINEMSMNFIVIPVPPLFGGYRNPMLETGDSGKKACRNDRLGLSFKKPKRVFQRFTLVIPVPPLFGGYRNLMLKTGIFGIKDWQND